MQDKAIDSSKDGIVEQKLIHWAKRNELIGKVKTGLRFLFPVVALGSTLIKNKNGISYAEQMMGKLIHWETGDSVEEIRSSMAEISPVLSKLCGAGFIWVTGELGIQVSAGAAKLLNNMTKPDKVAER